MTAEGKETESEQATLAQYGERERPGACEAAASTAEKKSTRPFRFRTLHYALMDEKGRKLFFIPQRSFTNAPRPLLM
jgi:hypothetical protein